MRRQRWDEGTQTQGRTQEEDLYKRNVDEPTLEDHVDKVVLPKVMQVKKFGFMGRTKYTHLADQDTTAVRRGHTREEDVGVRGVVTASNPPWLGSVMRVGR
jgi:hypothetical protein